MAERKDMIEERVQEDRCTCLGSPGRDCDCPEHTDAWREAANEAATAVLECDRLAEKCSNLQSRVAKLELFVDTAAREHGRVVGERDYVRGEAARLQLLLNDRIKELDAVEDRIAVWSTLDDLSPLSLQAATLRTVIDLAVSHPVSFHRCWCGQAAASYFGATQSGRSCEWRTCSEEHALVLARGLLHGRLLTPDGIGPEVKTESNK